MAQQRRQRVAVALHRLAQGPAWIEGVDLAARIVRIGSATLSRRARIFKFFQLFVRGHVVWTRAKLLRLARYVGLDGAFVALSMSYMRCEGGVYRPTDAVANRWK